MKHTMSFALTFLLVACGGGDSDTGPARLAYVANASSDDISAYQITVGTGELTLIDCGGGVGCNGSNFAAGSQPVSITADPSGTFAYVANLSSNDVSAFLIATGTGALTLIDCGGGVGCNGSNFAAGSGPQSATVDPSGAFAYVANVNSDDISAYQITAVSGALTLIDCGGGVGCNGSNFAAGTLPFSVTVDPSGAFIYVANSSSNDVSAYQITAGTGTLTLIDCGGGIGCNGSNFTAGFGPQSVTVDPSGAFAYVANTSTNDVSAYQITAGTGALTPIDCGGGAGCNASRFEAGTQPRSITVDPSGAFAYVTNGITNDVSAYQITAGTGALTPIDCGGGVGCNGSNFAAGSGPQSVTVDPSGAFAYVANVSSDDISAYQITAGTGALTPIDCGGGVGCNGSNFAAGFAPYSVTTTR